MNETHEASAELIYHDDEQAHYQTDTGAVLVFEKPDWPLLFDPDVPVQINLTIEVTER